MTITREQIDKRIASCANAIYEIDAEPLGARRQSIREYKEEIELCTLALKWLDMEPRPLSEIADFTAVAFGDGKGPTTLVYHWSTGWREDLEHHFVWPDDTLAIPLNALPKVKQP